jgi:hypothetical protein
MAWLTTKISLTIAAGLEISLTIAAGFSAKNDKEPPSSIGDASDRVRSLLSLSLFRFMPWGYCFKL